ncbi:MAG: type II toxin-antitoxin system HicB family antitoxin [Opitutaceae bacterium]|nr:type II toxin-antitoxin system HicB family antitoxin [Opitutaceae bacterium]
MTYGIVFEKIAAGELPPGYYYAHIPVLGLTTHGSGVEGARAAARDLIQLWLEEKRANGEPIAASPEFFFSTVDVPSDALQGA